MTSRRKQSDHPPALAVRVADAARMLGIGKTKTYELIGTGEIEVIKVGRATLVIRASLEAFIARRRPADGDAPLVRRKRGRPRKTFYELISDHGS